MGGAVPPRGIGSQTTRGGRHASGDRRRRPGPGLGPPRRFLVSSTCSAGWSAGLVRQAADLGAASRAALRPYSETSLVRLFRVRFGVRLMMAAVAVVGLGLGDLVNRRQGHCRERIAYHAEQERIRSEMAARLESQGLFARAYTYRQLAGVRSLVAVAAGRSSLPTLASLPGLPR